MRPRRARARARALGVAAWLGLAGCEDGTVLAPVIDSPPAGSDAAAFPGLDEVELSVAVDGATEDLVSATFSRGDAIQLDGVPFGERLVIHMLGRKGQAPTAYGRTCRFALRNDETPPAPHLYFANTAKWADWPTGGGDVRIGGLGISVAGDGGGLFVGGTDAGGSAVTEALRFDPLAGAFGSVGQVSPRTGAVAVELGAAVVLVGGLDRATAAPATFAEVIRGDQLERVDEARLALTDLAVTALSDGTGMAFGGRDAAGTVSDGLFSIAVDGAGIVVSPGPAHLAVARAGHTATRLSDDVDAPILILGGIDAAGAPVAVAELYQPAFRAFTDPAKFAPHLVVPRSGHQAVRLPDGRILVFGGVDATGTPVRTVELFSRETGFVDAGTVPDDAGVIGATLTLLPDGRLLLAGGLDATNQPTATTRNMRIVQVAPGAIDIDSADRLAVPRSGHQVARLCDGTLMLVGGTSTPSLAERYNPSETGRR